MISSRKFTCQGLTNLSRFLEVVNIRSHKHQIV
nr:MAG TPA: hypothetical protein [Caudoviricetes sp.]